MTNEIASINNNTKISYSNDSTVSDGSKNQPTLVNRKAKERNLSLTPSEIELIRDLDLIAELKARRKSHRTKSRRSSTCLTSSSPIFDLNSSKMLYYYTKRLKNIFLFVRNSSFFNLFIIFIVSILSNSIYYNFFYDHSSGPYHLLNSKKLTDESSRTNLLIKKPSLRSLIAWSSQSNYLEPSSILKFEINSFDHVTFPSLNDKHYASNNQDEKDIIKNIPITDSIYSQLNKEDESDKDSKDESIYFLLLNFDLYFKA